MRIYMAGLYAGGRGAVNTTSPQLAVMADYKCEWILESYHYIGKNKLAEIIRRKGDTIFLDSGAFSMFTQGIQVDLKAYAQYIKDNQDIIHVASSLDVIGQGHEQDSYDNVKTLESYGVRIQPVHHARDQDHWLQKYLDEGYDYIFLGGMVPESTDYLRRWLDRMWEKYLMHPDGSPRVRVHGFGLTQIELMQRFPWFSVDSTSWVMTSRFGGIYLDFPADNIYFPKGRIEKVQFSSRSGNIKEFDRHYDNCPLDIQRAIRQRVEELGYRVEDLRENYGWRDRFNVEFFKRFQKRPSQLSWRGQGELM